jgi:hypothetical protein
MIILRWIFKEVGGVETGWSWLRIGTGRGALVNTVMNSGSIKCGEFLD